jgi:hypothetical protein
MLISNTQLTVYVGYVHHKKQNRLQHNGRPKNNEHARRQAIFDNGYLVRLNRCVIDDCAAFNFW